jgi:NTE family protein
MPDFPNTILVLGGGNALAAFQVGAYGALHRRGYRPSLVAGCSMGALNAAVIAGNPAERRIERLAALWSAIARPVPPVFGNTGALKLATVMQTRLAGIPGLFRLVLPRLFAQMPLGRPALYESAEVERTLRAFADFSRPADGDCRLVINATDLMTGEPVVFSSASEAIEPVHVRASGAMPGDFEPIAMGGRRLGDGGLTANLPLLAAIADFPKEPTLCIAIDLYDRRGQRLETLDDLNQRRSDILFAAQAESEIERLAARHRAATGKGGARGDVLLLHLVYAGSDEEISQKEFDFSAWSIEARQRAGEAAMEEALTRIPPSGIPPGFTVMRYPP